MSTLRNSKPFICTKSILRPVNLFSEDVPGWCTHAINSKSIDRSVKRIAVCHNYVTDAPTTIVVLSKSAFAPNQYLRFENFRSFQQTTVSCESEVIFVFRISLHFCGGPVTDSNVAGGRGTPRRNLERPLRKWNISPNKGIGMGMIKTSFAVLLSMLFVVNRPKAHLTFQLGTIAGMMIVPPFTEFAIDRSGWASAMALHLGQ